jgi:glycosyltransferase involved in cell wall biosynthesis
MTIPSSERSSDQKYVPESSRVCAIIPGYNEHESVGHVVRHALKHVGVVVVVDDGSSDDTGEKAREAGAVVLRHESNMGKGEALKTGFQYAYDHHFDLLVTLDADGQHDPSDIPFFLRAHQQNPSAVIIGNRMTNVADMPFRRRWTNAFMSWLLSHMVHQTIPDTQCGFRLYPREAICHIQCDQDNFAAESELIIKLARAGRNIVSVPIKTIYGHEVSAIRPVQDTWRFIRLLWSCYRTEPVRKMDVPRE